MKEGMSFWFSSRFCSFLGLSLAHSRLFHCRYGEGASDCPAFNWNPCKKYTSTKEVCYGTGSEGYQRPFQWPKPHFTLSSGTKTWLGFPSITQALSSHNRSADYTKKEWNFVFRVFSDILTKPHTPQTHAHTHKDSVTV